MDRYENGSATAITTLATFQQSTELHYMSSANDHTIAFYGFLCSST